MLIVLGGLPGTGKTTIARRLAALHSATYLRVDEIEHALRSVDGMAGDIGPAGYVVSYALASSNLAIGQWVVADCVNPVRESRQAWRAVAARAAVALLEVELVCSDAAEHRRRVESRQPDIAGFGLPSWKSVRSHRYEAWREPHLVIDTALLDPSAAFEAIERNIKTSSN